MAKAINYYYDQLNKEQQRAYYAIKEGLLNLQDSFPVPMLSRKELSDIYFMIRMDWPEIFYSVTFSYRHYQDSTVVELIPQYLFSKDKIREHRQAMSSRVNKLARQAESLEEKDKELFIHDFLVNNVRYDKLKKEYSHEIIGALGNGVAVCEGIAKAVKVLCDRLDIWCIVALSEANPEKGIKYRHACVPFHCQRSSGTGQQSAHSLPSWPWMRNRYICFGPRTHQRKQPSGFSRSGCLRTCCS